MLIQDLVDFILQLCSVTPAGDTPAPEDRAVALFAFNQFLEHANIKGLEIFSYTNFQGPLVANKGSYAMGSGAGDFNTPRPAKVAKANVIFAGVNHKLEIVGVQRWSEREEPGLTGQRPTIMYNDNQFPNVNISLHPKPSCTVATTIDLYYWEPLGSSFVLGDTYDFPPGYAKWLAYNVAVDCCESVFGRPLSQSVANIAATTAGGIEGLELSNIDDAPELPPGTVVPYSAQAMQQAAALQQQRGQ